MDDLISRKAAIEVAESHRVERPGFHLNDYEFGVTEAADAIASDLEDLPLVQQWIPCSERLPEEHDSFMNKFYGTDKFKPGMFRRLSNKVIVTERFPNGETQVTDGCTHDGKWWFHSPCIEREVIAWKPLPEPYTEEES